MIAFFELTQGLLENISILKQLILINVSPY